MMIDALLASAEVDEPSMRAVEWVLALVAAVVAGVLAFIR